MVKNFPAHAGDTGSVPGLGRAGNPLQYSCLRNPMVGGDWWATVHGVKKESDMTQWLNHHSIQSNSKFCEPSANSPVSYRPGDRAELSCSFLLSEVADTQVS